MTRVRYRTFPGHSDRTRTVRRLDPLPVARKVGLRLAQAMKPVLLRTKRVRSRRSGFSGPEYPLPAPVAANAANSPIRPALRSFGIRSAWCCWPIEVPGVGDDSPPARHRCPYHGPLNRLRRKGFPQIVSVNQLPRPRPRFDYEITTIAQRTVRRRPARPATVTLGHRCRYLTRVPSLHGTRSDAP